MNSGRGRTLVAFAVWLGLVALAHSSDSVNYGKANPPWKTGKYYNVESEYEMTLNGIVMEIWNVRKAHEHWTGWWNVDAKVEDHYYSNPFSGKYACYLNYRTFGANLVNKNNGSVFRDYVSANVEFSPLDAYGRTVFTDAEPSWLRRVLFGPRSEEVSNEEVAEKMQDADFMFREIFMTDGRNLDTGSWYFFGWNQSAAFNGDRMHHMDVFKKSKSLAPISGLERITPRDRAKIKQQIVGDGVSSGWSKTDDLDLGYNVAQAEAKMMTYAIYGQRETRNVGDKWTIDAETLESFFPLQSRNRKPFSFDGGVVVLTVASDDNGIVTVKSLPSARIDGMQTRTDLHIQPRTEASDFKPSFRVDMQNERDNYVRFTIDSFNEVCKRAEMKVVLENYSGAVPKVEQLSLNDPKHFKVVTISDGSIILHCMITTNVEDKE